MANICDLLKQKTGNFVGDFRCRSPQWVSSETKKGPRYWYMQLEDFSGEMEAIAIEGRHLSPDQLYDMDVVMVSGHMEQTQGGKVFANLTGIARARPDELFGSRTLPQSSCPKPECLPHLISLEQSIRNKHLKEFVRNVLSDDKIALPFIRLPASLKHHHCEPGGLLEHSIECANFVRQHREFGRTETELAIVAALFHDIGKVRTFNDDMKRSMEGYVLDHDAVTLETLSGPLFDLEHRWRDGAVCLRYLWTWNHANSNTLPLMPVALAVQAADRISASRNAEKRAFAESGNGHRFATLNCTGRKNRFWRPHHR